MKRTKQIKSAFDLIEEGTHLLRTAPAGILAVYYAGTAPFILALLYFWADMSRNPFGEQHLAEAALGMAMLFAWMKFWQALFARLVRARIAAEAPPRFKLREALRIAAAQTILQPLGLLPIGLCLGALFYIPPLGILLGILLGCLLPFFYTVTAVTDGSAVSITAVFRKAWRFWQMWPKQNYVMLAIAYFFGLYVFLNWSIFCLSLPGLIKTLFGVETVFTRSPFSMLNTTFFAAMFSLTYLCVDPILKTLYALRCFYGESVQSGADLKAELKRFSVSPQGLVAALILLITASGAHIVRAADSSLPGIRPQTETQTPPAAAPRNASVKPDTISPTDFDHVLDQTIHERKYTWRMPREKSVEKSSDEGVLERFFEKIGGLLQKWGRAVYEWLRDLLRKLFPHREVSYTHNTGDSWMTTLQLLFFILIAAVVCALAIFIYRVWQQRRPVEPVASEAITPAIDLADENIGADQLPEDGWTKLARELLERGEFRLAMRAFYLANLSHLAQRNLISLARFKSNRDYERELRRRGHSFPDLLSVFGDNLSVFERIWYGLHEVNGETVHQFATNVERMKAAG